MVFNGFKFDSIAVRNLKIWQPLNYEKEETPGIGIVISTEHSGSQA